MAGENPEDPRSGAPDEILSKTKWQRFQVLIMGPAMNIILAIVVMAVVLAQGTEVPAYQDEPPVIGGVTAGSPADKAGIQAGYRILTVAGREVDTWEDLFVSIGTRRTDRDVTLTLLHDGQPRSVTVRPIAKGRFEYADIGVLPDAAPIVRGLVEPTSDYPAAAAGIKPGDAIIEVNGERIVLPQDLTEKITKNGGRQVTLTIRRGDRTFPIMLTPVQHDGRPMIGVAPGERTKSFKPSPFDAIRLSVVRNVQSSGLIFRTLAGLFTGETSVRQLQGPVGIAQLSGESAQAGWIALLSLMAIISLNLGILNLMPVPVLDGGHILIMALEGVARRDFSVQVKEKMLLAGFVVLMMLMVTVIYNDLTRISWIERLMPWRQ
jgi:regulator of sigma E protease